MTPSERVRLTLAAAAMALGSVELVRREVLLHRRRGQSWLRVDAGAGGALFTVMAAVAAWTLLVLDRATQRRRGRNPRGSSDALVLLVTDERVHCSRTDDAVLEISERVRFLDR